MRIQTDHSGRNERSRHQFEVLDLAAAACFVLPQIDRLRVLHRVFVFALKFVFDHGVHY